MIASNPTTVAPQHDRSDVGLGTGVWGLPAGRQDRPQHQKCPCWRYFITQGHKQIARLPGLHVIVATTLPTRLLGWSPWALTLSSRTNRHHFHIADLTGLALPPREPVTAESSEPEFPRTKILAIISTISRFRLYHPASSGFAPFSFKSRQIQHLDLWLSQQ
ncbi:uncharacterized protein EI97DRAFT_223710 [Westerdykella ornata]|uniref:Uncharacterized protein n=1 Tax=Westerdykella ornata TaxID=318751 RepID=A0A6A6JT59_WESOR|nr:uncharacterized protein EI97DRAFT_223710 [Westerdykella ornata]KAF2278936.1 hypothetical protein EI97DRAFT_223710 [Westerdykella ornata]